MAADRTLRTIDEDERTDRFVVHAQAGAWLECTSSSGRPAFVRSVRDVSGQPGRVVGNVRIRFLERAHVELTPDSGELDVAVLECLVPDLIDTFRVVARDISHRVRGSTATADQILSAFATWRHLLADRPVLTASEQLGLWGELALFSRMAEPDVALAAWHGPDNAALDFLRSGVGIEVKTSTRAPRHTLRWSQAVFGATDHTTYLASIRAHSDPGGASLPDQVRTVQDTISDPDALLTKLLANGYREAHAEMYDKRWTTVGEPRLYAMSSVPKIGTIPQGVSNLRWDVDLSGLARIDAERQVRVLRAIGSSDG